MKSKTDCLIINDDTCPFCNSDKLDITEEKAVIHVTKEIVAGGEIPYLALVVTCRQCGASYTDDRDEDRRNAVCMAHRYWAKNRFDHDLYDE